MLIIIGRCNYLEGLMRKSSLGFAWDMLTDEPVIALYMVIALSYVVS